MDTLIPLQIKIYELDKYLENSWALDQEYLSYLVGTIKAELHKLGYNNLYISQLMVSFNVYMERELAIRVGRYPSELPIEDFYFHKSCDVKLHRKIIMDQSSDCTFNSEDWKTFDLITEVNDDIEDLTEDTEVINGNRLLFSLNLKSHDELKVEYLGFIEHLKHLCSAIENEHIRVCAIKELSVAEENLSILFSDFDNLKPLYRLSYLESSL